ncbi:hypothetical protein V6N13_142234 [Hibiscus sabdariffa]|uniref:Uncharacterized protein n=1 Tax=Hibiscus sabdariffa TaxID=183260 RepID=A0ABR2FDI7_9ROSI
MCLYFSSLIGNRLTGSIPKELANLSSLTSLHFSSNNFTGEIPETYARLTTLKEFKISDNNFRGQIPEFIFQNWRNITKIIISDLNGAEAAFPQLNAKLPELDRVDLSFNRLSGEVPDHFALPLDTF